MPDKKGQVPTNSALQPSLACCGKLGIRIVDHLALNSRMYHLMQQMLLAWLQLSSLLCCRGLPRN